MWKKMQQALPLLTPISRSCSSDFAYRLYSGLIVKKLKIEFSPKAFRYFCEILDLSSPNTYQIKIFVKDKMLGEFFSPS